MTRQRKLAAAAVAAAAALAGGALPGLAETVLVDGVPHVRNGAAPRDGLQHVRLEEQWRAGDRDDDVLFGLVTRVRGDETGALYVMDAQLSRVHVYGPDGAHLRTLFGEGEGPGEVRGPRDLVLMEDGRVGVVQEVPGRLIFVDGQGSPAGVLDIGGPGVSHGALCQTFGAWAGGGVLVVAGFVQAPGADRGRMTQTSFLSGFDTAGREVAGFCRTVNEIELSDFTFDERRHLASYWWNADVDARGRVYAVPQLFRYEVHVFAPDGTPERVIGREIEPLRRTEAQKRRFVETVRAIYHGLPFEIGVEPAAEEPAITYLQRGLRVHPDGEIWVLPSRGVQGQPEGVMATFDVFAPDGEFVRQVAVHGPWDSRRDGVFFLGAGDAVVVTGYVDAMMAQFTGGRLGVDLDDEAATMEVIRCRVRR